MTTIQPNPSKQFLVADGCSVRFPVANMIDGTSEKVYGPGDLIPESEFVGEDGALKKASFLRDGRIREMNAHSPADVRLMDEIFKQETSRVPQATTAAKPLGLRTYNPAELQGMSYQALLAIYYSQFGQDRPVPEGGESEEGLIAYMTADFVPELATEPAQTGAPAAAPVN